MAISQTIWGKVKLQTFYYYFSFAISSSVSLLLYFSMLVFLSVCLQRPFEIEASELGVIITSD